MHQELRLYKTNSSNLPEGIELVSYSLENDRCKGVFSCAIPLPTGSMALPLIPLVELSIEARFHPQKHYPSTAPSVYVTLGSEFVPSTLLDGTRQLPSLELPILSSWAASSRLKDIFIDFSRAIQMVC